MDSILKNFRNPWEDENWVLQTDVLDTSVLDNNVLSNNQSAKGKAISVPQAIKILDDINTQFGLQMSNIWKASFNSDKSKARKLGTNIYKNKSGEIYNERVFQGNGEVLTEESSFDGDAGEIKIPYEYPPKGEEIIGDYHTHPFSDEEKSNFHSSIVFDFAHSLADVLDLGTRRSISDNYISIVETDNKRFALVILDNSKAKKFYKTINKLSSKQKEALFKGDGNSLEEIRKNEILNFIGSNNGIALFETTIGKKNYQQVKKEE
jgi:hypothetical protein